MDELDRNLIEAWERVGEWLKQNPRAAARRYERGMRAILQKPMAACCLVVRASDHRIDAEYDFLQPCEDAEGREPHYVLFNQSLLEKLCGPVHIPWPGVTYHEAAVRLGMGLRPFYRWIEQGIVRHRLERFHGLRTPPTPVVWSDTGPLNPNFHEGRRPLPMWGELWEVLWRGWPDDLEQKVLRVPRTRPNAGEEKRRGWNFLCPGRPRADGKIIHYGKECGKLYAPIPPLTIAKFFGLTNPIELMNFHDREPHFACNHCWAPFYDDQTQPDAAWNKFITHITGGLLKGSEVVRPPDLQMRRDKPIPEDEQPTRIRSTRRLGPRGDRRRHKHVR